MELTFSERINVVGDSKRAVELFHEKVACAGIPGAGVTQDSSGSSFADDTLSAQDTSLPLL